MIGSASSAMLRLVHEHEHGMVSGNSYLESLLQGQPQLPPSPLAWFNQLRANAVDRAGTLKVPTTRDEEWRFTDISPLAKLSFQPVHAISSVQK